MRALLVLVLVAGCGAAPPRDPEGRPAETQCRPAAEHYAWLAYRELGDATGRPDPVLVRDFEEECREIWTREEAGCIRMALTLIAANACFE